MITEILVAIIVVGIITVFFANRILNSISAKEEHFNSPEVVSVDAGKIRKELEETANEIIERMAVRIDRLELLLKEADRKSDLLQRRLNAAEKTSRISGSAQSEDPPFSRVLDESIEEDNRRAEALEKAGMIMPKAVADSVRDSELGKAMRGALGSVVSPDTYSMDLDPDNVAEYIKSRSVDEIPDKPVKSLVDEQADVAEAKEGNTSK